MQQGHVQAGEQQALAWGYLPLAGDNPLISTCTRVRPVGHVTPATSAQPERIAAASPNRNTNTPIGDIVETASAPIG